MLDSLREVPKEKVMDTRRSAVFRFGKPQSIKSAIITISLTCLVIGGLWEFGNQNVYLFSKPSRIATVLISDHSRLLEAVLVTAKYVFTGLVFGSLIGFISGLILGSFGQVRALATFAFYTPVSFPRTAVFLVIVGYFGVMSDKSVYTIAIYMTAALVGFLTFRATKAAIERPQHPEVFDTAVMLYHSRIGVIRAYVLPMVLPESFRAILYVTATLWPFMVFAEPTGAPGVPGIGNYIYDAFQSGKWDHLFASAIVFLLVGLISAGIVHLIQMAVMRRY